MKELVKIKLAGLKTADEKYNFLREFLQELILQIIDRHKYFKHLAFVGGTALRVIYDLPRFSEDLDFSAVAAEPGFFAGLLKKVKEGLGLAGYQTTIAYDDQKTVLSASIKFQGLLQAAGMTGHKTQLLSIKIEIDSNPPAGAGLETRLVNKYFPVAFQAYDTPSLFAGKLHCVYTRKYLKGRDFFDIGWYLSKWPDLKPNLVMLCNALKQSGWKGDFPEEATWRKMLSEKTAAADWEKVKRDVENFLENPGDRDIFSKQNIMTIISKGG